jgi:NitT/TauT family transport system substrate-binding protein
MIQNRILIGACLMFALFGLAGTLHAQAQKIRISLSSRSNTNTSYYVAQARGFFKDEGLEVEFIQINPRLGAMAVLNGDVTFTTSFVSTFRGIVQGLPMKTVFILLKKGTYHLMVRPDLIKDIQDLKGKKLGVTAVNGGDHIIGRELMRMKGLDPNLVQAIAVGDPSLRLQAAISGAVQAVSVPPPYDFDFGTKGLKGDFRAAGDRRAVVRPVRGGSVDQGKPASLAAHDPRDLEGEPIYRREPGRNAPHHDQVRAAVG